MNTRIRETEILTELTFGKVWLVWDEEHSAYWAPDERGYVSDIEKAGRYTFDDAARLGDNPNQWVPAPERAKLCEELTALAKTKKENEMSHTPGPWLVKIAEHDKNYIRIRGTKLGTRYKIANVLMCCNDETEREEQETSANARLISAAPELLNYAMLEAEYTRLCDRTRPDYSPDELIEWLKDHGVYETGEPVGKWLGRIRTEAIRKAIQGKMP